MSTNMLVDMGTKKPPAETREKTLKEISALEGSMARRVHQVLKTAILSLDYPPGFMLRKADICEELQVSRSPVSEAIARLASEGLVNIVPQSGSRVAYFSMAEIREGVFLREALELAGIGRVALDRTSEQLARLNRNLRLQELLLKDRDLTGFYETDEEFHAMLMQFTGHARLRAVARMVSLQVSRARMLLLPTEGRAAGTLNEHHAIADAIRQKDRDLAESAMRNHLGQLLPRIEPLERQCPDLFRAG